MVLFTFWYVLFLFVPCNLRLLLSEEKIIVTQLLHTLKDYCCAYHGFAQIEHVVLKKDAKTVFIIVSFASSRRTSSWEDLNNHGSQTKRSRECERGRKNVLLS